MKLFKHTGNLEELYREHPFLFIFAMAGAKFEIYSAPNIKYAH